MEDLGCLRERHDLRVAHSERKTPRWSPLDHAWRLHPLAHTGLVKSKEARCRSCLQRITLHGCRHTFASLMIAAGVNAKALSTFMGHANISITLDRSGT